MLLVCSAQGYIGYMYDAYKYKWVKYQRRTGSRCNGCTSTVSRTPSAALHSLPRPSFLVPHQWMLMSSFTGSDTDLRHTQKPSDQSQHTKPSQCLKYIYCPILTLTLLLTSQIHDKDNDNWSCCYNYGQFSSPCKTITKIKCQGQFTRWNRFQPRQCQHQL